MRDAPRALVTDGGERSVLAVCRGLHLEGYHVTVASSVSPTLCRWSRTCATGIRVADPRRDAGAFIDDLRSYLSAHPIDLLIPASDFSLRAVSSARGEIEGLAAIGLPARDVVDDCFDRERLAEAAAGTGLAPLEASRVDGYEQALAAAEALGFPVVLKSISSTVEAQRHVSAGPPTRLVADARELGEAIDAHPGPLLVQRSLRGEVLSFGGVRAGGRLLGTAVSEYLRTWPPEAGNAAFSRTIRPPAGMAEAVDALLGALGWEGIFELEMIREADGRITPIDLNPRPYGSMSLAVAAGANLPALWAGWLRGLDPEPAVARAGVLYRWEDSDARHLLWQLRRGRLRGAASVLRPRRGVVHAHFQLRDPLPLVARAVWLARGRAAAVTESVRRRGCGTESRW